LALNQTLTQLINSTRKCADIEGTSALLRHPDSDVTDYVNRGVAALCRILTLYIPDQQYLSSASVTLVSGTATYSLNSTFRNLISVDLTANGTKSWLTAYNMNERPILSDSNIASSGIPLFYRLRAANIEYLPTPGASGYTSTLWYVPVPVQLSSGGTTTFDTIDRLDDYIIWYAAREVAKKDRLWDLHNALSQNLSELRSDIQTLARSRDMNSPPRVRDDYANDRFGRSDGRDRYGRRLR
jgi:hypothetical protein